MKNFKKIIAIGMLTLAFSPINTQAMDSYKTILPIATGIITHGVMYYKQYIKNKTALDACYDLVKIDGYTYSQNPDFKKKYTPEVIKIFSQIFLDHPLLKGHTVIIIDSKLLNYDYADAITVKIGSQCILGLPDRFIDKDRRSQQGFLSHERTHAIMNHNNKLLHLSALSVASIATTITLSACNYSSLRLAHIPFIVGTICILYNLSTPFQKSFEKEADLFHKTPEEIIGLLLGQLEQVISKERLNKAINALLTIPIIDQHSIELFFNKETEHLSEDQIKKLKETAATTPQSFIDLYAQPHEMILYLRDQFEKQVKNPKSRDIPTSIKECTEALSTYFEKEEDYKAGVPTINAPFVQKRVDFLRAKLIELENKKA